jgi:hypothetical protein
MRTPTKRGLHSTWDALGIVDLGQAEAKNESSGNRRDLSQRDHFPSASRAGFFVLRIIPLCCGGFDRSAKQTIGNS